MSTSVSVLASAGAETSMLGHTAENTEIRAQVHNDWAIGYIDRN